MAACQIEHKRGLMAEVVPEEPPYPFCHDSKQAYGDVVASQLGASLAKFACTGSTYENGIINTAATAHGLLGLARRSDLP